MEEVNLLFRLLFLYTQKQVIYNSTLFFSPSWSPWTFLQPRGRQPLPPPALTTRETSTSTASHPGKPELCYYFDNIVFSCIGVSYIISNQWLFFLIYNDLGWRGNFFLGAIFLGRVVVLTSSYNNSYKPSQDQ